MSTIRPLQPETYAQLGKTYRLCPKLIEFAHLNYYQPNPDNPKHYIGQKYILVKAGRPIDQYRLSVFLKTLDKRKNVKCSACLRPMYSTRTCHKFCTRLDCDGAFTSPKNVAHG